MPQPHIGGKPGVAIHFHGCKRATVFRPIKYDGRDVNEESFASLPSSGPILTVQPHLGAKEYDHALYTTWQRDWITTSPLVFPAVYFPPQSTQREDESEELPSNPDRFALKLAAYVDEPGPGQELTLRLYQEALFYKRYLSSMQGEAVPKHYGIWCGVAEWGAKVAISIMQWGGIPYKPCIRKTIRDTDEVK